MDTKNEKGGQRGGEKRKYINEICGALNDNIKYITKADTLMSCTIKLYF